MVSNKSNVEGSICEAYLTLETTYFCEYYFEYEFQSKFVKTRRNEDEGYDSPAQPTLSCFDQPGRPAGKTSRRYLTDQELAVAELQVLLNCEEVKPFVL